MALGLYLPRPLRAALAIVVLLALAGATYQGITTALERRRFPHPGRLIDVGGHQLQIYCTGRGAPTVVLEAPAAGLSASWSRVQEALAPLTRVCSYDRAGLGWSERGDGPFDPHEVPLELQALLAGAAEKPPFLIAGVGLGAAYAQLFAARFPATVAGIVLLDAPGAGRSAFDRNTLGQVPAAMPWLARVGIPRLAGTSRRAGREPAVRAFLNRPDHLTRASAELARWDDTVKLAAAASDGAIKMMPVIAAGLPGPLGDDSGAQAAVDAIRKGIVSARR